MNTYICLNCNKEYKSRKKNSKFCSIECKHQYNRVECNCDYCGKPMVVYKNKYEKLLNGKRKHIYCSRECADKGQITSVIKVCKNCGKEYKIYNVFKDIQEFCSRDCYYSYLKDNSNKHEVTCEYCGNIFITNRKNQKYCCRDCASKAQRNRTKCICKYCGKEFERKKSEVDKNKNHYCSYDCKLSDIRWNQHDLDILRQYYNKIDIKELQNKLSKKWSLKAIRAKSQLLGLGVDKKWSTEDEILLKETFPIKPINEIQELFPKRTFCSIVAKAHSMGLVSKSYKDKIYTDDELEFLKNNYLEMTDEELANHLGNNRSPNAIHQKLYLMGYTRPNEIKKDAYINLTRFVRERLAMWKKEVKEYNNYTCCLTGSRSNIIVHHCRSFNLLFEETIDVLNFEIKENFCDYTDEELLIFVEKFMEIQDYYNAYVCITESIHKLFHREYGYGNNTEEQWDEFVNNYKNGKYDLVA